MSYLLGGATELQNATGYMDLCSRKIQEFIYKTKLRRSIVLISKMALVSAVVSATLVLCVFIIYRLVYGNIMGSDRIIEIAFIAFIGFFIISLFAAWEVIKRDYD